MKFIGQMPSGGGYLFDDANFKKSVATKFKRELAGRITERIKEQELTVAEAAQKAYCTQADIKRIRKSEIDSYSIEELVELAKSFGFRIDITVEVPGYTDRQSPKLH